MDAKESGQDDVVVPGVAGMLLTGGLSRRLGRDKASLVVRGESLAVSVARVMAVVAFPLVEVGPGRSGLRAVTEDPPGCGPLVAIGAGHDELRSLGHTGPTLVLACDLPHVSPSLLRFLACRPGEVSVVPVVSGMAQPLCARWSGPHLDSIASRVAAGERSMRSLLEDGAIDFVDEAVWSGVATPSTFSDLDTREDLELLGLHPVVPEEGARDRGI